MEELDPLLWYAGIAEHESLHTEGFQVLHSKVGSWPYPQTLDWAGKAYHGQTV